MHLATPDTSCVYVACIMGAEGGGGRCEGDAEGKPRQGRWMIGKDLVPLLFCCIKYWAGELLVKGTDHSGDD